MTTVSREFIVEKVRRLFPTTDTSEGSRVDRELIQPILAIFEGYDEEDYTEFLSTRIKEFDSSIVTAKGSANFDILISPLRSILYPTWWELKTQKDWSSLENYASMPSEELDALVANYFMTRSDGARATGRVRVYFASPTTVIFNQFVKFTTRSGIGFMPSTTQVIQSDVMSFNQDGSLYYVDLTVEAEDFGTDYNIVADQITNIEGLSVAHVKATNLAAFTGGDNEETNEELYTRAKDAITVRNLNTKKSIRHIFLSEFSHIEDIEVIGFGDLEMERDLESFGTNEYTTLTQLVSGDTVVTLGTATVTGANYIHVGGKVDVHLFSTTLIEDYLDIYYINPAYPVTLSKTLPNQVNMPLIRVKNIERLDPAYLTSTGQYIPYAHPIDNRALRDFYFSRDEHTLERAVGTVRMFFEKPTSVTVDGDTVFTTDGGLDFIPVHTQTIAASGMAINTGQNITTSEMDTNVIYNQDIVYYYFDIAIHSKNVGDINSLITTNTKLTATNYTSEGWTLSTSDEGISYSIDEILYLTFSATFNDGISTDGEAIRVIYEWAPTVNDIQTYADSDLNRVVTSDLLIKHFQPAYVDIAISYEGPPLAADMEIYSRNFINNIAQGEYFEIADLVSLLYQYGATRVILPIEAFVLILGRDRVYTSERFEDRYRTDKRVHLVARNVDINKLG